MIKILKRNILIVVMMAIAMACMNSCDSVEEETISTAQLEKAVEIEELTTTKFMYNGIAQKINDDNEVEFSIKYNSVIDAIIEPYDIGFDVNDEEIVVTLPDIEVNENNITVDPSISLIPQNTTEDYATCIQLCKSDVLSEVRNNDEFIKASKENLKSTIEALILPLIDGTGYNISWKNQ